MNSDIKLLARLYKSNTEEAIEWIRSHPKDKSADITSKVKKIYYGYGGKGAGNSEYNIEIKSDGIYIRDGEGADTNKYTYSAIVRELKEYMDIKQEKFSPEIDVLNLDVKAYNALKRAGINTIADIESQAEQLESTIPPKHWKSITNALNAYKGVPIPGSWVEKDMLGDELTFDEITNMVGELIVMDLSTESHEWYKVEKVEEIFNGTDGKRHLRTYDGSKQRGSVNEIFFDKNQHRPQRAWRLKQPSDFPCDNCGYDEKGCCNYPETPDDFCVMGDKQVPAAEDNNAPPTPAAFDYSVLDDDTANNLRQCESVIRMETAGYFTLLGAKFKEAQDLLANHGKGTFEQWYSSMGFKRQTVYNLIQRYEFGSSPTIGGREEAFEALPLTLSYEISKPTAPSELIEKVLDGDITSNAEYKKLLAELERTKDELRQADANSAAKDKEYQRELEDANKKVELAQFHEKQAHESYKRISDASSKNYESYQQERRKNADLQEQIKQLEKRPVDVAIQTDESALKEKEQEIAELKEELARMSDTNVKTFAIKITLDEFEELLDILKAAGNSRLNEAIKHAQLLRI